MQDYALVSQFARCNFIHDGDKISVELTNVWEYAVKSLMEYQTAGTASSIRHPGAIGYSSGAAVVIQK